MKHLVGDGFQHKVYDFGRRVQRDDFIIMISDVLKAHGEYDQYIKCFEEEVFKPLKEIFPQEPEYSDCSDCTPHEQEMFHTEEEMVFWYEIFDFIKDAFGNTCAQVGCYNFKFDADDYLEWCNINNNKNPKAIKISNDMLRDICENDRSLTYDETFPEYYNEDPLVTFRDIYFQYFNKNLHLDKDYINEFLDEWIELFKPSEGFETSLGELINYVQNGFNDTLDMLDDFYPALKTYGIKIDVLDENKQTVSELWRHYDE